MNDDVLNQPEFQEWLAERPPAIRAMVMATPPHKLYELDGRRCRIHAYCEDGTLKVHVLQVDQKPGVTLVFEREVFGVDPNELVPAEENP